MKLRWKNLEEWEDLVVSLGLEPHNSRCYICHIRLNSPFYLTDTKKPKPICDFCLTRLRFNTLKHYYEGLKFRRELDLKYNPERFKQ